MRADADFVDLPQRFWASVRSLSQECGYNVRGKSVVKAITVSEMVHGAQKIGLNPSYLMDAHGAATPLAVKLKEYFAHRADVLNDSAADLLMDASEAKTLFDELVKKAPSPLQFAMNKQTGQKAKPAYFTGIIKMLLSVALDGDECDFDPQRLTTFTADGEPIRTLARRVDGAYSSHINPTAIWEIKEYYWTTTFGSRIADGVYETLLDGLELMEMHDEVQIPCLHYLMIDARDTWWSGSGRPYLCRMVDMLHMGLVDEVLMGREAVDRIPQLVAYWQELKNQG